MKTKNIEFNGNIYVCRVIIVNDEELTIAPLRLLDALHPGAYSEENNGFASSDAVNIDEGIFYYTSDDVMQLSDGELVEELKEDNPDLFEDSSGKL